MKNDGILSHGENDLSFAIAVELQLENEKLMNHQKSVMNKNKKTV